MKNCAHVRQRETPSRGTVSHEIWIWRGFVDFFAVDFCVSALCAINFGRLDVAASSEMGPWTPRHYLSTLLGKKLLLLLQLLLFHPFSQKYVDDDVVVGTRFNYTNRRRQEWETRSSGILSLFIYGETSLLLSRVCVFFFPPRINERCRPRFSIPIVSLGECFECRCCTFFPSLTVLWLLVCKTRALARISQGDCPCPKGFGTFCPPSPTYISCSPYGFVQGGHKHVTRRGRVSPHTVRHTTINYRLWRAREVTFNFQNYTARTVPSWRRALVSICGG